MNIKEILNSENKKIIWWISKQEGKYRLLDQNMLVFVPIFWIFMILLLYFAQSEPDSIVSFYSFIQIFVCLYFGVLVNYDTKQDRSLLYETLPIHPGVILSARIFVMYIASILWLLNVMLWALIFNFPGLELISTLTQTTLAMQALGLVVGAVEAMTLHFRWRWNAWFVQGLTVISLIYAMHVVANYLLPVLSIEGFQLSLLMIGIQLVSIYLLITISLTRKHRITDFQTSRH